MLIPDDWPIEPMVVPWRGDDAEFLDRVEFLESIDRMRASAQNRKRAMNEAGMPARKGRDDA